MLSTTRTAHRPEVGPHLRRHPAGFTVPDAIRLHGEVGAHPGRERVGPAGADVDDIHVAQLRSCRTTTVGRNSAGGADLESLGELPAHHAYELLAVLAATWPPDPHPSAAANPRTGTLAEYHFPSAVDLPTADRLRARSISRRVSVARPDPRR
jgi:hypothetical protein